MGDALFKIDFRYSRVVITHHCEQITFFRFNGRFQRKVFRSAILTLLKRFKCPISSLNMPTSIPPIQESHRGAIQLSEIWERRIFSGNYDFRAKRGVLLNTLVCFQFNE